MSIFHYMPAAYEIQNNVIIMHRSLTELDHFVKQFLTVFNKHTHSLIVSGYVSISTGRTRGTEDVDILLPLVGQETFKKIFEDLIAGGFWCYQSNSASEAYEYLQDMASIRFARQGETFPNMECIPVTPKRIAKYYELNHPQRIKIEDFEFNIPPVEFEILYKEIILGSKKDIEDARHLRVFFKEIISPERFNKYKPIIEQG